MIINKLELSYLYLKRMNLLIGIIFLLLNYSCKKKNNESPIIQPNITTNNMVLKLKFNNEIVDSSANKNVLNPQSISYCNDSLGNINTAAYFNGYSSSIISSDNNVYDLKSSFTFSVWIKPETNGAYIIQKQMDSNGGGPYSFDYFGGKLRIVLYFTDSQYFILEGSTPIVKNKWQYLAATWDGNSVKLYVNGIIDKDSSLTGKTLINSSKPLGIGLYQWNPSGYRFKGAMDNLEIYNIALSQQAIASKYLNY